jgi:hypothetical protein
LPENVNPEIDRNGYHGYNNGQDDEQWRYFCFSTPDNIKNNSICDSNDDVSDNKSLYKEVHRCSTPYTSVVVFDLKLLATFGCLDGNFANTFYKHHKRSQATDAYSASNRVHSRHASLHTPVLIDPFG